MQRGGDLGVLGGKFALQFGSVFGSEAFNIAMNELGCPSKVIWDWRRDHLVYGNRDDMLCGFRDDCALLVGAIGSEMNFIGLGYGPSTTIVPNICSSIKLRQNLDMVNP